MDLLKEQISIEATEMVIKKVEEKLDTILRDQVSLTCEFLSINKACEYLDVGRSTFYTLLEKHKPLKVELGGSPRYAKADLDKMFKLI